MSIRAIDAQTVHRITSGQVVIDLQSAVKELVENSLDAGATAIDVRFQNHGLKAIDVVDNGCGIHPKDHDSIALKHYTSKLCSFDDLARVLTFGFRGEALSSLCALTDGFTVTTATCSEAPMGTVIEMDRNGKVRSKCKIARQQGTTVSVSNLFKPLPVRRKELERNAKREFQKALNLLHTYALVPCALENRGVRLAVSHQTDGGRKVIQFKTDGSPSIRASVLAIWGSKALENVVDLDLSFDVETEKSVARRLDPESDISIVTPVKVQGLISKFAVGAGRTSSDRQFFFVNGRPYNPGKVQKAINEVYRTFNANQSPFVIANIVLPTNACDINVSPDKRTIFLHSENNLVQALKTAIETAFSSARSTYDVSVSHAQSGTQRQSLGGSSAQMRQRAAERPPLDTNECRPGDVAVGDGPAVTGVPRPSIEPGGNADVEILSEPEPEPTLVVQPDPALKIRTDARDQDRPGNRAPSEPLFFPESDEEASTRNDAGSGNGKDASRSADKVVGASGRERGAALATSAVPSTSTTSTTTTTTTTTPDVAREDKPCSMQTVLSTRGAVWNLRRDDEGGRERKRTRGSSEGDRVWEKRKSFRSSLSRFLSDGSKPVRRDDGEEDSESESEGGGKEERLDRMRKGSEREEEEMDELDDEDDEERSRPRPRKAKENKGRRGAGSDSSQVTMVLPSDDERVMDVDEPPSLPPATAAVPPPPVPQTGAKQVLDVQDVDILSDNEEEWAFSSTLVGTYVPPAGKSVEPPPPPPPREACPSCPLTETNANLNTDADIVSLRVDLISIGSYYLDMYDRLSSSAAPSPAPTSTSSATFRSAVSSANLETGAEDAVASAALSRIISKADFERMTIVGQFNLGFIVVRKRSGGEGRGMDDLFIVDQHAADEKWNFETLQEKTVIASQRLFRPQELQLTAADEMLAIENMDVLKRNGFELGRVGEQVEAEACEEETSEGMRTRLQLIAQPTSKDTVFDMKDLEELIHLMQDRPKGTMVRCSKARAMFAMRACRRSVMIGKALDRTGMTAIIRHMGTMDQPWHCPHGRPTMRHLSDLTMFGGYAPPRRAIGWEAYGRFGSEMEEA